MERALVAVRASEAEARSGVEAEAAKARRQAALETQAAREGAAREVEEARQQAQAELKAALVVPRLLRPLWRPFRLRFTCATSVLVKQY